MSQSSERKLCGHILYLRLISLEILLDFLGFPTNTVYEFISLMHATTPANHNLHFIAPVGLFLTRG